MVLLTPKIQDLRGCIWALPHLPDKAAQQGTLKSLVLWATGPSPAKMGPQRLKETSRRTRTSSHTPLCPQPLTGISWIPDLSGESASSGLIGAHPHRHAPSPGAALRELEHLSSPHHPYPHALQDRAPSLPSSVPSQLPTRSFNHNPQVSPRETPWHLHNPFL